MSSYIALPLLVGGGRGATLDAIGRNNKVLRIPHWLSSFC
jgi:hypothetical protein